MSGEKKVTFSDFDQVFYIPNKSDKKTYTLSNREGGQLKKRKKNIIKIVYKKTKKVVGRFTIVVLLVISLLIKIDN